MNDKDIKKLSRTDLLELLITQTEENEQLRSRLAEVEEQLLQKNKIYEECGSIAEASLRVNGVFEAAQKAADEYLENIKEFCATREDIFKRHEESARIVAERIISEAEKQGRLMEDEASRKCKEIIRVAEKEAEKYWETVSLRLEMKMKNSQGDLNDE